MDRQRAGQSLHPAWALAKSAFVCWRPKSGGARRGPQAPWKQRASAAAPPPYGVGCACVYTNNCFSGLVGPVRRSEPALLGASSPLPGGKGGRALGGQLSRPPCLCPPRKERETNLPQTPTPTDNHKRKKTKQENAPLHLVHERALHGVHPVCLGHLGDGFRHLRRHRDRCCQCGCDACSGQCDGQAGRLGRHYDNKQLNNRGEEQKTHLRVGVARLDELGRHLACRDGRHEHVRQRALDGRLGRRGGACVCVCAWHEHEMD